VCKKLNLQEKDFKGNGGLEHIEQKMIQIPLLKAPRRNGLVFQGMLAEISMMGMQSHMTLSCCKTLG